mmetsp:Transcript_8294/g.19896  ORF Transcript_8294/g.19896 Transcript_8294/m.19896 type:complete len:256 (+) Transcript_8294:265-1032(+)
MERLISELLGTAQDILAKISHAFSETSPQTLRLTGILGLAAFLFGLYQLRGDVRNSRRQNEAFTALHTGETQRREPSSDKGRLPAATPVAAAVSSRIPAASCVTISCPGVLLKQCTAAELQEGAELATGAAEVLTELSQRAQVYLLAEVEDDVGEATVRGAMEAAGLLGTGPGRVPPQRMLFCGTHEGKVSVVRQLEPDLHMDNSGSTVESLKRFIPRLLHVGPGPEASGRGAAANVEVATSLREYFAVPDGGSD